MAKKSMIQRDIKRAYMKQKYQERRIELKKKIRKTDSTLEKIELHKKLDKFPRNSSKTRIRNRCWLTGRARGYYRDFGLSRHVFREMAHECLLPGVVKSSW
uniref:Small ribosomal subunit protein uS14c n=1 Tax=Gronococcus sybilensis TaxID=3028029 RepID=A0A9Y1I2N5_9RHOD|nr:ribosomal protein S14 [Gronococcus sybilensis]